MEQTTEFISPYENTEYLAKKWNYSDLEVLYQNLNNLISSRVCASTWIKGLVFKPIANYSTLAGAYSGNACWMMKISYEDYSIYVAHRQPDIVIKKAIYFFQSCFAGKTLSESNLAGDFVFENELESPATKSGEIANP